MLGDVSKETVVDYQSMCKFKYIIDQVITNLEKDRSAGVTIVSSVLEDLYFLQKAALEVIDSLTELVNNNEEDEYSLYGIHDVTDVVEFIEIPHYEPSFSESLTDAKIIAKTARKIKLFLDEKPDIEVAIRNVEYKTRETYCVKVSILERMLPRDIVDYTRVTSVLSTLEHLKEVLLSKVFFGQELDNRTVMLSSILYNLNDLTDVMRRFRYMVKKPYPLTDPKKGLYVDVMTVSLEKSMYDAVNTYLYDGIKELLRYIDKMVSREYHKRPLTEIREVREDVLVLTDKVYQHLLFK